MENNYRRKRQQKREVIFNPNADTNKTLQQVTIHEMLHDMAGSKDSEDLFKLILDKNKTRDGYSDSRNALEEMYSQVYDKNSEEFKKLVDEEEVADTLAQKLGEQDFINSLNKEKPNVFKRIYDWIVDKLNKFTGSKNEKLYWEDVKNKFENAYRQDYQRIDNNVKYHISENLSNNIDEVLNNIKERNPVKLRDFTPKVLVKNGIKDLPMYENPSYIRKNILTKEEASKLGLSINSRDHYHGLGKDIYKSDRQFR